MRQKINLTEELYRMRKLMGYDSKEELDNITSYERLIEETLIKKTLLNEQEGVNDPFAGDVNCENNLVKHPIYASFKKYILKHKDDKDKVGDTVKIWGGSGAGTNAYNVDKKYFDSLIANIDVAIENVKNRTHPSYKKGTGDIVIGSDGKEYKISEVVNVLNQLKTLLTKYSSQNVALKQNSKLYTTAGSMFVKLKTKGEVPPPQFLTPEKLELVKTELRDEKNLSSGGFTLSCDDKFKLLNSLTGKVEGERFNSARYIKVSPTADSSIKVSEGGIVETEYATETITYPPQGTEGTENGRKLSETMMPDDGYKMSDSSKEDLKNLLLEGIQSILSKPNGEITDIIYGSAASTSTVNSSFSGIDKNGEIITGEYNRDNNNKLVDARINSINSYLKSIIDENIKNIPNSDKVDIKAGESVKKPNEGPEWTTADPKGDKGEFKGNYGPLFLEAKKKNPKETPQTFYSLDKRKNNPSIKEEYDKVFGSYRFNGGYINISGKWSEKTEEDEVVLQTVGDWRISVSFKKPPPPPPPPKKGKGGWGNKKTNYGREYNTLGCPFQT
jgi:hypothetical protein